MIDPADMVVWRVCGECEFATADEHDANEHFELTGHLLAISFNPPELEGGDRAAV
jgi:hypothetical protein